MKSAFRACAAIAILWALSFGAATAHHSFSLFDRTKQVTMSGVAKEWQWTNPHCWLFLEVKGTSGRGQGGKTGGV